MATFDIVTLIYKAQEAISIVADNEDTNVDIAAIVHTVKSKLFELSQKKVNLLTTQRDAYTKTIEELYPSTRYGMVQTCANILIKKNAEHCARNIECISQQLAHAQSLDQYVNPEDEERHEQKDPSQWVVENMQTLNMLLDMPVAYHEHLSLLWWCLIDAIENDIRSLRRAAIERLVAGVEDMKKIARFKPAHNSDQEFAFSGLADQSMSIATVANIDIALGAALFEANTRIDKWLVALVDIENRAHATIPNGFLKHAYLKCGVLYIDEESMKNANLDELKKATIGQPPGVTSIDEYEKQQEQEEEQEEDQEKEEGQL
jgi:hypothetical protein